MRHVGGPWPAHRVDPWALPVEGLDLESLGVEESLLALANGHIGLRGTLEEGEPRVRPGTYVNGFFEERPLPHAEVGYGFPEQSQTVVNVTDGKLLRLLVGDSPFDLRYGTVHEHRRTLDLRSGVLHRVTRWTSPNGASIRVTSRRLVSLTQRSVAAIRYEVEALDGAVDVALQSDLLTNEPVGRRSSDPREAAVLESPLLAELAAEQDFRAVLVHRTRSSGRRVAAGMDHLLDVGEGFVPTLETWDDLARLTIAGLLEPGRPLRLVKLLAYGWSVRRSAPALRDQVDASLAIARVKGWDGLAAEQRAYLDDFWHRADIEIDGDPALQQAVRLSAFHVLQAGARTENRPIAAKGLTGPGYDGHTFWDTETFVLPMLTYTVPEAARSVLEWRHRTLPRARQRAAELGLAGAAFPWRTINGEECSGYWPAGTAAFHITADVADATARYVAATGDARFERECGVEILVESARLWSCLGHFADDGSFRIDGVTGPDEYTAVVDNNVYTNLMVQRNLREAVAACERHPDVAAELDVLDGEVELWRAAADAIPLHFDGVRGVHPQSEGFTDHAEWDFVSTPPQEYPLMLHHPYFQLYRTQVVKQADLVLAMHLRGDAFTPEQKEQNFAYYEARTVRDSSLSAATQAVLAAEVGHLDLAHDYWSETAFMDLHNLHGNVGSGLHLAAMAGAWTAAVAGFGGMRDHDGEITFAPRLPPDLDRLSFRMTVRGCLIEVTTSRTPGGEGSSGEEASTGVGAAARHGGRPEATTYRLLRGEELRTSHHGEPVLLRPESPVTLPVPPAPRPAPVSQPPGREPYRRRTLRD